VCKSIHLHGIQHASILFLTNIVSPETYFTFTSGFFLPLCEGEFHDMAIKACVILWPFQSGSISEDKLSSTPHQGSPDHHTHHNA